MAAASCHSCACCGCVGLVTGVVSILHPQFGSEWGCRCYTSCWCSYGFPLHLFFLVWVFWHSVFGHGSVFNLLFSALCRSWLSALAIFVGMCMYTSLFVCYIFIFVCSCLYIVYILVFFFSFVWSLIPVFLGILGFGSAILLLISGVWLVPVVLLLLPGSPLLVRVVSRVGVWVGLVSVVVPVMGGEHFISRLCCGCFTFLPFLSSILACLALHIKFHFHWGRFVPCWFG